MALSAAVLFSLCITFFTSSCTAQEIRIDSINQKWVKKDSTEVKVCLTSESKVDDLNRFHLDIISDSKSLGHVEGPTLETDRRLCFAGITLGKEDLDKAVAFTVSQPGSKIRVTVVETFMIVPQITRMSEDAFQICWTNPDGLTFALDQKDAPQRPRPYHAPCHTCCQALISQSPDDIISLEAEGPGGFRQTVQLHLPRNSITSHSEKVVSLTIRELHKVVRDDDPSGRKQNMKLVLDPHEDFEADGCELKLSTPSGEQPYFYCENPPAPDATEIEFNGNFVDSSYLLLTFKKDGAPVAFGSASVDIKDPGSRVALVGSPSVHALRVDPGGRGEVDVPGRDPCRSDSAPCYYFQEGLPLTPPTLCEDLTDDDNNPFTFCDEIVSQVQDPGAPTLELRNRNELIVGTANAQTEVGVRERGGNTNLASDINCAALEDKCVVQVDVGEEIDILDVMVVMLDEEKFVTGSVVVEFEVHGLETTALSPDVLQVSVDPRSEGNFTVEVCGSSSPPCSEIVTECHFNLGCRTWFSEATDTDIIQVWKGTNGVSQAFTAGPGLATSTVKSITSLRGDGKTRIEVEGSDAVTCVDLITFEDKIASEKDCLHLNTTATDTKYSLETVSIKTGDWEFVIVGYSDTDTILEMSHTGVSLSDLTGMVNAIGAPLISPDVSFRVDVKDFDSVFLEDQGKCMKEQSPCYFPKAEVSGDSPIHCVEVINTAVTDGTIDHCDNSVTDFVEMTETPTVELMDGTQLTVEGVVFNKLEVILYDPNDGTIYAGPKCSFPLRKSCVLDSSIPDDLQVLKLLIVKIGLFGGVQNSLGLPFTDLKTSFQEMTDENNLEVRWKSPEEVTFEVVVAAGDGPSEVSIKCGGPGEEDSKTCKAYFTDMSSAAQKVEVRNGQITVSVSAPTSTGNAATLTIGRISQLLKSPSQLELTFSSDGAVSDVTYFEYVVIEDKSQNIVFADGSTSISLEDNSVTFAAELPTAGSEVTVLVVAHKDGDSDALAFGKVTATFEDIVLPEITKVGTEEMRSLKVETAGTKVTVNGDDCEANHVCYFHGVAEIPDPPEVCRTDLTDVQQCDMTAKYNVLPDMAFSAVELAYTGSEEEELIVFGEFNQSSATIEAVLYTDKDSLDPISCGIDGSTGSCSFTVKPSDDECEILLMAQDETGALTESTALHFEDLKTSFQELDDVIEVRWKSSGNDTFYVQILEEGAGPGPGEVISQTSVTCGGTGEEYDRACKAYFTSVKPRANPKVEVKREKTSVSASVPSTGAPEILTIKRIIQVSQSPSQIEVEFTSSVEIFTVNYLEFVVIHPPSGSETDEQIVFADFDGTISSGTTNKVTFNAELPTPGQEVTVLLVAHQNDQVEPRVKAFGRALATFEELQAEFQILNEASDVEVRWQSSQQYEFTVQILSGTPSIPTERVVTCGSPADDESKGCKAYFTNIPAEITRVDVIKDITAISVTQPVSEGNAASLTIGRISQLPKSPPQLELTFSSNGAVSDVTYFEYVVIEDKSQNIVFANGSTPISSGDNSVTFEAELPTADSEVTVLVVAHKDGDSDALAFGKVTATFEDINLPTLTKVGTNSLKVDTRELSVIVNGESCNASSSCYILEPETILEPPEVCINATDDLAQCDLTGTYKNSGDLSVAKVDIRPYDASQRNLIVSGEFNATSTSMEGVIYTDGVKLDPVACSIDAEEKSCTFFATLDGFMKFKMLLVALDKGESVTGSHVEELEDFQTSVQQVTHNIIEVLFRASDSAIYKVTLDPAIEGEYISHSVECGGPNPSDSDMCSAYFIGLEATGHYTVSVRKEGKEKNTVSASVQMDNTIEGSISITSLRLSSVEDGSTNLNVCFEDRNLEGRLENSKYRLFLMDSARHQLQDIFQSYNDPNGNGRLCVGPLYLAQNFDTKNEVKILVKLEEEEVLAAGEIELYLLDPQEAVVVKYISSETLRVQWTNKNNASKFEVDAVETECGFGSVCIRYLHPESPDTSVNVTLREYGDNVQQEARITPQKKKFSDMTITKADLNWEGRMRVCFSQDKGASYVLGMEDDAGNVQESDRLHSNQEDGQSCVLSSKRVEAEGYVSLRTILTALDAGGIFIAAGTTNVTKIFLNTNRRVSAAIDNNNKELLVSWFLIDNPKTNLKYSLNLERSNGGSVSHVEVERQQTSYIFDDLSTGRYSACVAATFDNSGSVIRSETVCSSIQTLSDAEVPVPKPTDTIAKTIGADKILVVWEKPEAEVDGYVISWELNSARSSQRSNSTVRLHPLWLTQKTLRGFDKKFQIVPASSTSVEIPDLLPTETYNVCIQAIKDAIGEETCDGVTAGATSIDQPQDLKVIDNNLEWSSVSSATSYLVEWRPASEGENLEGDHKIVTASSTSWSTENLASGVWELSVRAITDSTSSESSKIIHRKEGIVIAPIIQVQTDWLYLRWSQYPTCSPECEYKITLSSLRSLFKVTCSGEEGACEKYAPVQIPGDTKVSVSVESKGTIQTDTETLFISPDVRGLSCAFTTGSNKVTVSWTEVEVAKLYNITLYKDSTRSEVLMTQFIGLLHCDLEDVSEENLFTVQPCGDEEHCGDVSEIRLERPADLSDGPVILISVIGSIMFVAVVIFLILIFLNKRKVKRKEQEELRRIEETRVPPLVYNEFGSRQLGRRIPMAVLEANRQR